MKNSVLFVARALVIAVLSMALSVAPARAQDSFVRVVHGLSAVSKIDVIIDGEKRFNDLEFGGVAPYVRLDSNPHSIQIQSNNPTRTLFSATRRFKPYDFHTLAIYGLAPRVRVLNSNDSAGNPAYGSAQLTAYNLSPDAGPFDVVTYLPGGETLYLLRNVRYGQSRSASIPAIPMTVRLVRRGTILKTLKGESPRAGRKYALYAVGRESRNFRALLDVTASQ